MSESAGRIGLVVIGRNEAPRLQACLEALRAWRSDLVYVDSGSTDGTPEIGEREGVQVLRIVSPPFSAARGRQAGLDWLLERHPDLRYVQFVDGDCILDSGWIEAAVNFLDQHNDVAIVAGRLRERHARESLLARLVDVDWDLPIGAIDSVGGIFMARVEALKAGNAWRADLVTGEELDLSARLRSAGWTLHRLPAEMTLHDIGIRSFREMWRRSVRSGFTYAEVAARHGWSHCRRWLRRAAGNLLYGGVLPVVFLVSLFVYWPVSAGVAILYGVLIGRVSARRVRRGDPPGFALFYAATLTLLKTAAAIGAVKWLVGRIRGRQRTLMEYKTVPVASRG